MVGRTLERVNAQTRYGVVALLVGALLLFVPVAFVGLHGREVSDGTSRIITVSVTAGVVAVIAGLVLLIVGLVRRPRAVQPRRD